ncbi:MAG: hypothetical protein ACQSGP_02700 [Frankia sp.]
MGIRSPIGSCLEEFARALAEGVTGIRESTEVVGSGPRLAVRPTSEPPPPPPPDPGRTPVDVPDQQVLMLDVRGAVGGGPVAGAVVRLRASAAVGRGQQVAREGETKHPGDCGRGGQGHPQPGPSTQ